MLSLETKINGLGRVTAYYQARLERLGINTVRDLIFYFPHRYEDFSNIIPISEVGLDENVCLKGKITNIRNYRTRIKKMMITEAEIKDESGSIKAIWFNQLFLTRALNPGDLICLTGKTTLKGNYLYLSSPVYEKIGPKELIHTGRLVPIYSQTEGLSSRWLRYMLRSLLVQLKNKIPETLPQKIIEKESFAPIEKALWQIHFPDSIEKAQEARKRFSFEELFILELYVIKEKTKIQKEKAHPLPLDLKTVQKFVKSLPFKLTDAQRKVSWQILKDLEKPAPMSRLLQGDVGAGKTVVATIAALNAIQTGSQIAFMAPTEILAKQHFDKICAMLKDFKISIGLLTSKQGKLFLPEWKEAINVPNKEILAKIQNNEIMLLIGTHALIQETVKFKNLGLVILDEQHRFGTQQRAKLCQDPGSFPHLLSMTATPIPRSLALTVYGDLDLSIIDEMPKGRKKIITKVVPDKNREQTYKFIKEEIKKGRQAFVICPRIEAATDSPLPSSGDFRYSAAKRINSSKAQLSWAEVKTVKEEYKKLSEKIFPDLKIAMLHGRIKPEKKDAVMANFKNKKYNLLVSTSVVEVGIDIPNASVIMIEGAERFGLAQLHQFRGRVGRSQYQSYCFLFTSSSIKGIVKRLGILSKCENGFELAEEDLKLRGPGDFLGKRQSGIPDLAMSALGNIKLIEKTKNAAQEILDKDPNLKKYPLLKKRVERFSEKIHLE